MENEAKTLLMEYLARFAEHYEIRDAATSFKKRADVLDKLKAKDHNAWVVISALIDAFIREDRVRNDKEKYEKARPLWDAEHAAAEKEKVQAEMQLIEFCKASGITVGKIGQMV
jgi:hypothetical protein